jgi:hypothetical protein
MNEINNSDQNRNKSQNIIVNFNSLFYLIFDCKSTQI